MQTIECVFQTQRKNKSQRPKKNIEWNLIKLLP